VDFFSPSARDYHLGKVAIRPDVRPCVYVCAESTNGSHGLRRGEKAQKRNLPDGPGRRVPGVCQGQFSFQPSIHRNILTWAMMPCHRRTWRPGRDGRAIHGELGEASRSFALLGLAGAPVPRIAGDGGITNPLFRAGATQTWQFGDRGHVVCVCVVIWTRLLLPGEVGNCKEKNKIWKNDGHRGENTALTGVLNSLGYGNHIDGKTAGRRLLGSSGLRAGQVGAIFKESRPARGLEGSTINGMRLFSLFGGHATWEHCWTLELWGF